MDSASDGFTHTRYRVNGAARALATRRMRRRITSFAWLAVLLLLCPAVLGHAQTRWPPIRLPGTVAFRAHDNPAFAQPGYDDSTWKHESWWKVAFKGGPVWLRWHIKIPPGSPVSRKPMGLFLTAYASSQAWWDGQRLGHNGLVASTPGAERPGHARAVFFVPGRLLHAGTHVIALRLSAQHASRRIATPVDDVRLDTYGSPLATAQTRYRPSLASIGALVFAILILLAIRWRSGEKAALWLALACTFLLAQLATEVLRAYVNYPYTWQGPRLALIAGFAYLTGFTLLGFLLYRYERKRHRTWLITTGILAAPALLPLGPGDLMTAWILFVYLTAGLLTSLAAVRAARREAWLSVTVISLLLATLLIRLEPFLHRWLYTGFTLLLGIYFIDYARAQARISQALARAKLTSARLELELLKKHLRPHFLMNTLTALAEWLELSPSRGAKMVEAVADEFRMLDRFASKRLIPLRDELALTQTHMTVMGYRHDQTYGLRHAGLPENSQVPPAIFHTLAENALTHNRYESPRVTFSLEAEPCGDRRWRYTFQCPPATNEQTKHNGEGTGTAYIKARLSEAYGKDWSFTTGPTVDGGWTTAIEMPAG